jgi:hypothetical protein
MKIATLIALLHPFLILLGTAIAPMWHIKNPILVGSITPDFMASQKCFMNTPHLRQTTVQVLKD